MIKLIWHDGVGLCMLTKRLEQGQFVWPSASTMGSIALRAALHQQGELHAETDKLRLLIQRLTHHQCKRRLVDAFP